MIDFIEDTDIAPFGLDNEFPEKLYVVEYPQEGKYGCYVYQGIHGLATFEQEGKAILFTEFINLSGLKITQVDFDEAREIAKSRPLPITVMYIMDDFDNPIVHYVK